MDKEPFRALLFRQMFEKSPDIKIILNPLNNCIEEANLSASVFYRLPVAELKNVDFQLFSEPELIKKIKEAPPENGNMLFGQQKLENGEIKSVEIRCVPLLIHGEKRLDLTLFDITDRLHAEEELKQSRDFNETILNNMNDALCIIDVEDYKIMGASRLFLEQIKISQNEVVGRTCYSVTHHRTSPCTGPEDVCPIKKTLETGLPTSAEHIHYDSSGNEFLAEVSVAPIRNERGEIKQVIHISKDITEKKRTEENLRLAARVFESTTEGIMVTDVNGRIQSINSAFSTITGYSEAEVIGQNPNIKKSGRHSEEFYKNIWDSLFQIGHWQGEIYNKRKNGEIYPEWLNISAIRNENGDITNFVGLFADISQIKLSEERLDYLAHHDSLTDLPNRLLFQDRLQQAINSARRNNEMVGLIFIDLDRFKVINDTQGHGVGDRLLSETARRLQECVRVSDTVARVGGDEFTVILPGIKSDEDATKIAEKIIKSIEKVFIIEGNELYISASLGIALHPADTDNSTTLLNYADKAMYHAKKNGRDNYQLFTEHMAAAISPRIEKQNKLQRALDNDELILLYQPLIRLDTGEIVGVEALVYWQDNKRLIPPGEFLPIAEESGQIVPLGKWVIRRACLQNKSWQESGLKPLPVSVNLSAQQLLQAELVESIEEILEETKLDAKYFELEISEKSIMQDVGSATETLEKLATKGIRISVDDFGIGCSSLSYLEALPVNNLKIDLSLIRQIPEKRGNLAITKAVIALGHSLHKKVIAEGVETNYQLSFLLENKCDQAQGIYFCRPLPGEELLDILKNRPVFGMTDIG